MIFISKELDDMLDSVDDFRNYAELHFCVVFSLFLLIKFVIWRNVTVEIDFI